MKKLLKRNQLMITALAIMLAIAGYLQFAGTNPVDKDVEADSSNLVNELEGTITEVFTVQDDLFSEITDIESLDTDSNVLAENYLDSEMTVLNEQTAETGGTAQNPSDTEKSEETTGTQVQPENDEIPGEAVFTSTTGTAVLADAKLAKEQVRSKNKETLLEIINNTSITDSQKQEAIDTMVEMTAIAEKETAAETLLQAKGFSDVVVSINGTGVDVVVNALSLTDAQRAQIEDIVKRKTEISAENIIISTVVE